MKLTKLTMIAFGIAIVAILGSAPREARCYGCILGAPCAPGTCPGECVCVVTRMDLPGYCASIK